MPSWMKPTGAGDADGVAAVMPVEAVRADVKSAAVKSVPGAAKGGLDAAALLAGSKSCVGSSTCTDAGWPGHSIFAIARAFGPGSLSLTSLQVLPSSRVMML